MTESNALVPERLDEFVSDSGLLVPGAEMFTSAWTRAGRRIPDPVDDWRERTTALWRSGDESEAIQSAISLFDAGDRHFGHCMLDVIPRLESVADIAPEIPVIISGRMPANARWWVRRMAPDRPVVEVDPHRAIRVRDLIVPLERARLWQGKEVHDLDGFAVARTDPAGLRAMQAAGCRVSGDRRRRLWLRRDRSPNNNMRDEEQALRALQSAGFESVYLECLDVDEVMSLLAETEAVVAPRSAALANLAHAAPGIRVLQLDAEVCDRDIYGSLVWLSALGHPSSIVSGVRSPDGHFTIPPEALLQVVAKWVPLV